MVGFQEFWQTAYQLQPAAFNEVQRIGALQNKLYTVAPKDQLQRVIRHLSKNAMNSLGATAVLCLNGYGHDAMKLARGTYEAYLNAAYLEKHPDQLDDYIDFYHILINQQLDQLEENSPGLAKKLPVERRAKIIREYERVEARFRKGKYHRNHWAQKNIWEMAEDVGLKDQHKTFYANTSNMHHATVWGLNNQIEESTGDAEIAPSPQHVIDALLSAHTYALWTLEIYNRIASLGHDAILQEARENYAKVWTDMTETPPYR